MPHPVSYFSKIWAMASPPLWEVIFWEKTMDYLGAQSRYTFMWVQKELVPPFKNPRNATGWYLLYVLIIYIVRCVYMYTVRSVHVHCEMCTITLWDVYIYTVRCVHLHCEMCTCTLWDVYMYTVRCVRTFTLWDVYMYTVRCVHLKRYKSI